MAIKELKSFGRLLYVRTFRLLNFVLHLYWVAKSFFFRMTLRQHQQMFATTLSSRTFVINLARRVDRLEEAQKTMQSCGIDNWIRVDAISNDNGALGCALSHKLALQTALECTEEFFMIFEDDVVPDQSFNQKLFSSLLTEFSQNEKFAVMCFAFSSDSNGIRVSENLLLDDEIITAAAYVIKRKYVSILQNTFSSSIDLLENGVVNRLAAIDIRWILTQKRIYFVRPAQPIFAQKPGWSDIENMNVNY